MIHKLFTLAVRNGLLSSGRKSTKKSGRDLYNLQKIRRELLQLHLEFERGENRGRPISKREEDVDWNAIRSPKNVKMRHIRRETFDLRIWLGSSVGSGRKTVSRASGYRWGAFDGVEAVWGHLRMGVCSG